MKGINRRDGFSRKYYGHKFVVRFKEYASRRTVCEIDDMYVAEVFTGVSRCHKDDKFDLIDGRKRAFARAMEKRDKCYERMAREFMTEHFTFAGTVRDNLMYRFGKLIEKKSEVK